MDDYEKFFVLPLLPLLAKFLEKIGFNKSFNDLSKAEIISIVNFIIDEHNNLVTKSSKILNVSTAHRLSDDIPFDIPF